jgi:hypothetical protein
MSKYILKMYFSIDRYHKIASKNANCVLSLKCENVFFRFPGKWEFLDTMFAFFADDREI